MTDAAVEAAARVLTAIYVDKTYFGNDASVREQLIETSWGRWVSAARAALAAAEGALALAAAAPCTPPTIPLEPTK